MKKRFNTLLSDDVDRSVEFRLDEIVFLTQKSSHILSWNEISLVKERPWFYMIYKGKIVCAYLYKRDIPQEELDSIHKYFSYQKKMGKPVNLKK